MNPMRKEILAKVKRVVIKIGSRVLTGDTNGIDGDFLRSLAGDVAAFRRSGREVVIVSSGAVASGIKGLGLSERPRTIPQKQAAAAVGQSRLMQSYEKAFSEFSLPVAQILLTRDDLANRQRFLNARATLDTLLSWGVVPIINENDTVATDEMERAAYRVNDGERCYHCKAELYDVLREVADERGLPAVVSGTNADDLGQRTQGPPHRPAEQINRRQQNGC